MTVVLPIHVLATIIWLGGLFVLSLILWPGLGRMESVSRLPLWQKILSKFFVWAWVGLASIFVTGISMVFIEFGGFWGVPAIHRINTAIGIPAIGLFVYLYFGPWKQFKTALSSGNLPAAEERLRSTRNIMSAILSLGVIASVVSVAGRYYI